MGTLSRASSQSALALASLFFVLAGCGGGNGAPDPLEHELDRLTAARFEAESMTESSAAISVVSDSNASGGKALKFAGMGGVASKSVTFLANAEEVRVRARGSAASGAYPSIRVFVDGTTYASAVLTPHLNSSSYVVYAGRLTVPAGNHTLSIKCMDAANTGEPKDGDCTSARNAVLDWVDFTYTTQADTTPPATTLSSDIPEGGTSTDGAVTFSFSGTDDLGVDHFECANVLQGQSASFSTCTSPKSYGGLGDGSYTFQVRAIDAAGNVDPTPATRNYRVSVQARINVLDFGATPGDASDDSQEFAKAMSAAGAGEVVYVPKGSGAFLIANVVIPSNTKLQVQAGAVIKKYGTAGGPLFRVRGSTPTTWAENIHIEGVEGTFDMDLANAGQETGAVVFENVRNFSLKNAVCIQNSDNLLQEYPSSRRPCLNFISSQSAPVNGVYQHPTNGLIQNVHSKRSPYGWGLIQTSGGEGLDFINISGEGGTVLRLENYSSGWTPLKDIYADGVVCRNGHSAVQFNPHGATHQGNFDLRNVTAESCESAVRIAGDGSGSYGPNVALYRVTAIAGSQAQVRDPDPSQTYVGAWVIDDSEWCVDRSREVTYGVQITDLTCNGLPSRNWP